MATITRDSLFSLENIQKIEMILRRRLLLTNTFEKFI